MITPMAPPARTISGVGWSAASVWIIIRPGRSWTVRLQREPEKPTAIYRPSTACRLRSSPRGRGPTVCGAFWSRSWGWRWCARREELSDQEDFYRELRGSEAALLFGSSFEQDGADELEIPLIRMDYPVFDEVCLTPRPHLGGQGTLHLLEDIFRGIMNGRTLKGALYQ